MIKLVIVTPDLDDKGVRVQGCLVFSEIFKGGRRGV